MLTANREAQRPLFSPQNLQSSRQKARYSDTGFELLFPVLESVTGMSYVQLLTERIIEPLDLRRTWLSCHAPRDADSPVPTSLYRRQQRVDMPRLMESSKDLISATGDLLTFHRAPLHGELFENPASTRIFTERRNRLLNALVLRYGMGTMYFTINRWASGHRRPLSLVGHAGSTGTWLFYCPELRVHLAGTIDQVKVQAAPFRLMA